MDTFSPRIYVSGVADDQTFHDVIEGYPQRLSVTAGEDVDLCVSTTAASYDVTAECTSTPLRHQRGRHLLLDDGMKDEATFNN